MKNLTIGSARMAYKRIKEFYSDCYARACREYEDCYMFFMCPNDIPRDSEFFDGTFCHVVDKNTGNVFLVDFLEIPEDAPFKEIDAEKLVTM